MSSFGFVKCEINHTSELSVDIGKLYLSSDQSDVSLVVEGEHFPVHRIILAARSDYFRALLYGGLKESNENVVTLKCADKKSFMPLLKYVYTGHLSLGNAKTEDVLDILGLCHEFGFEGLEAALDHFLRENLNLHNVCGIFESSRLYQLKSLQKFCARYMDRHASEIIKLESFKNLSSGAILELIERDSFFVPEVEIFRAVQAWVQANPDLDSSSVFKGVRLNLFNDSDIFHFVRPAGVFPDNDILDAILDHRFHKSNIRHRGMRLPEKNVAASSFGTTVVQGEMRVSLLDGNSDNYDMEHGYTWHSISDVDNNGIVIRLGSQSIINHLKMLLWDRDLRSYSYYVEVSVNQEDWMRVVDHSRHYCRSWQFLYFPERVVEFIRIVGTNNTVNKVFHVVSFEAMYTKHMEQLQDGIIVPKENVATLQKSASVIEGVSRSRNTLLNGETKNYDWDLGYTCHQLGSGCILVQLGQPYMISSIRLLLWDLDARFYSYYIDTSVNNRDWEVAVDQTRSHCQSWQVHHFSPRPVVFIKLRGTHNSANEVFHCVHLECPASVDQESQNESDDSIVKKESPTTEDEHQQNNEVA